MAERASTSRRPVVVPPGEGHILDGQMTFHVGEQAHLATAGSFIFGPQGIPHTFMVDREPPRVLVLATPSGFEHFALELGIPAVDDRPPAAPAVPGPDELGPVAARHGIEVVGPPRRVSHPGEG